MGDVLVEQTPLNSSASTTDPLGTIFSKKWWKLRFIKNRTPEEIARRYLEKQLALQRRTPWDHHPTDLLHIDDSLFISIGNGGMDYSWTRQIEASLIIADPTAGEPSRPSNAALSRDRDVDQHKNNVQSNDSSHTGYIRQRPIRSSSKFKIFAKRRLFKARAGIVVTERGYSYVPFAEDSEIRLLAIMFSSESVEYMMFIVDLNDAPRYDALSYVWGDPTKTDEVLVNGATVKITRNLADFLGQFTKFGGANGILIWVDAICIDQANVEERNQQVSLMGRIYSTAYAVSAWLGHEEEHDARAIQAMYSILDKHIDRDLPLPSWTPYRGNYQLDPEDMRSLEAFFQKPYFNRVWVIQELGLGSITQAMCGGHRVRWEIIAASAETILHRFWFGMSPVRVNVMHASIMYTTFNDPDAQRVKSAIWNGYIVPSPGTHPFLYLLQLTRDFQATDHRDKVFALLSHPFARSQKSSDLLIRADYKWTLLQVYRYIAVSLLQDSENLDFLSAATYRADTDWPYGFQIGLAHRRR